MPSEAPVALFVYKRPEHTLRTLEVLRANTLAHNTDLIVFSDGPRDDGALPGVEAVRTLLKGISGFRSISIRIRDSNWGLSRSLTSGVQEVLAERPRVIVVEDDIVTSKYFLQFMNAGLSVYENEDRVASIHGYCYPVRRAIPDTFFLRGADCWGWATWSRAWSVYDPDSASLLRNLRSRHLVRKFDFDGAFPYSRMLQAEAEGRVDSWAVRWYASTFLADMYTLYPGRSLVQNIGTDGSGEHSGAGDVYRVDLATAPVSVIPQPILESKEARRAFADFLRAQRPAQWRRAQRRLQRGFGLRVRRR